MKLGINFLLWTVHVTEEYYHLFDKLKKAGYDGVEIPLVIGNERDYKQMAQAIKDAGLEVTCTSNGSVDKNIISADASIRQAGLDHIKWGVDMAQVLGSKLIGGPIHVAPGQFTGAGPQEQEYLWAAEQLKKAAVYADGADVSLAMELLNRFECYLTNTIEQGKYLSQLVDHPRVGIHYDTHHANMEEKSITQAIQSGGKDILHVHFSESHRGILGQGQVDFAESVSALKSIGYDDWVTIECFTTKVDGLRQAVAMWREQFDSDGVCYTESAKYAHNIWSIN